VSLIRGKVKLTITLLCQPFLFDSNKDTTGCVLEYGECRGVSFLIDETSSNTWCHHSRHISRCYLPRLLLTLKHETWKAFLKVYLLFNDTSQPIRSCTTDIVVIMHYFVKAGIRSMQMRILRSGCFFCMICNINRFWWE